MPTLLAAFIGALTALFALYLKEVFQLAVQRRILFLQLNAYLQHFERATLRNVSFFSMVSKVRDRFDQLQDAYEKGANSYKSEWEKQKQEFGKLRADLKAKLEDPIFTDAFQKDFAGQKSKMGVLEKFSEEITFQRQLLLDGKNFISDRESASLGQYVAENSVLFKASMANILTHIRFLTTIVIETDGNAKELKNLIPMASSFVDSLLVDGEQGLQAYFRLTTRLKIELQKSLFRRVLDVLFLE